MHAIKDPIGEVREAALAWLDELRTVLVAHGLTAEVETKLWAVTATCAADMRGPRRWRRVQLAAEPNVQLHWYWRPHGIDSLEQIAPAEAVRDVVETIARALDKVGDR